MSALPPAVWVEDEAGGFTGTLPASPAICTLSAQFVIDVREGTPDGASPRTFSELNAALFGLG
jgi:hypothetical protein